VRSNVTNSILFDLGNTLVQYFEIEEFPEILRKALTRVRDYLGEEEPLKVSPDEMWTKAKLEDYENEDYSVRPLEDRLERIFELSPATPPATSQQTHHPQPEATHRNQT